MYNSAAVPCYYITASGVCPAAHLPPMNTLPVLPTTSILHEPAPLILPVPSLPSLNDEAETYPRLLLVEDNIAAQRVLRQGLEASRYQVELAASGVEALTLLRATPFDLVLLDLMLPDLDGLSVCRAIRAVRSTPILVLSGLDLEATKVALLEAGADDYLTKPVGFAELRARVRALLRRASSERLPDSAQERYEIGDLVVDVVQRNVLRAGNSILLSPTEWLLLITFCRAAGRPLSKQHLATTLRPEAPERAQRPLHTYIGMLREKLGSPNMIETIWGVGYRLYIEQ